MADIDPQGSVPSFQEFHTAESHIPQAQRIFVNRNLKM